MTLVNDANNVISAVSPENNLLRDTIPASMRCSELGCNQFAIFLTKAGEAVTRRCYDHVEIGTTVFVIDYVPHASGGWKVTSSNNGEVFSYAYFENFKKYALPHMISHAASIAKYSTMYSASENALEVFKKQVVTETVNFEGGCREGKTEFLQNLGLEWPMSSVTLTITFNYAGDPEDISTYELESFVGNGLNDEYDSMYVDIDWE